jgi:hypothetical protein
MGSVRFGAELARWWSAVASVTSKDDFRPVLTGVHVECGDVWSPVFGSFVGVTLTATDSYRLLSAGFRADVDGLEWDGQSGRVLVPGRAVKVPARAELSLSWSGDDTLRDVPVSTWKNGAETRTVLDRIGGDFPNWRNLFGSPDDLGRCEPVAVNGGYLGQLLSAMDKAGDGTVARYVAQPSDTKPGRWDMVGDGWASSAILMPVRAPEGVLGHLGRGEDVEAVAS